MYELANRPVHQVWHNAGFFWPEGGDFLKPTFDAALQEQDAFPGGAYRAVVERAAEEARSAGAGAGAGAGADGAEGTGAGNNNARALRQGGHAHAAGSGSGSGPLARLHAHLLSLSSEALAAFCGQAPERLRELLTRDAARGGFGLDPRHLPLFASGDAGRRRRGRAA